MTTPEKLKDIDDERLHCCVREVERAVRSLLTLRSQRVDTRTQDLDSVLFEDLLSMELPRDLIKTPVTLSAFVDTRARDLCREILHSDDPPNEEFVAAFRLSLERCLIGRSGYSFFVACPKVGFCYDPPGSGPIEIDTGSYNDVRVLNGEMSMGHRVSVTLGQEILEGQFEVCRLVAVAMNDKDEHIGAAELSWVHPPTPRPIDGYEFFSTLDEIDDRHSILADGLIRTFGVDRLFAKGDLLLLHHWELVAERRGNRLGEDFLRTVLEIVKRAFARTAGLAARPYPDQHQRIGRDQQPPLIVSHFQRDYRALMRYWNQAAPDIVCALDSQGIQAELFTISDASSATQDTTNIAVAEHYLESRGVLVTSDKIVH